jgi:hypothetical protein
VQRPPELPASFTRTLGGHTPGTVAPAGTSADRLWLRTCLCPGGRKCPGALRLYAGRQCGADDHLETCPPGAGTPGAGVSAALSGSAGAGGRAGDRRGGRNDDLHGGPGQTEGETPPGLERDAVGGGPGPGEHHDGVRRHLRERGRETGRRWGHCARAAGWGLNRRIHTLGDGADWIRTPSQEIFGGQRHFLCDFFHVSEYRGAASHICRARQPEAWRRTQQQRLRRGAVAKVIAALEPHLEPAGTTPEEAPVRNGHR